MNTNLTPKSTKLFRGDIRDKGANFTDAVDYIFEGEAKNQAHFHWFSNSKEYATDYATQQQSEMRGKIECSVVTEIELARDLNILDLDTMNVEEQLNFHKSLFEAGIVGNQFMEEAICKYNGDYSKKSLKKFFGYSTDNFLNSGQSYSDGKKGIAFKAWLIANGYDGYSFTQFKDKEFALINTRDFNVIDRQYL